jgi:hypothetical protein
MAQVNHTMPITEEEVGMLRHVGTRSHNRYLWTYDLHSPVPKGTVRIYLILFYIESSDADPDPNPDPDPPDPHVFEPPGSGSGSTSQRYGSGSGSCSGSESFYHHAKIVRKTLIPTIFLLFLTFIFEK